MKQNCLVKLHTDGKKPSVEHPELYNNFTVYLNPLKFVMVKSYQINWSVTVNSLITSSLL